jgi:transcriptional regulator with XRE-family HTH domain
MIIGERLRALREEKNLSQGDIEKRTGLLRCYISRVENGHTVPAVETLEKMARALEVPLYQLFYEGDEPPKLPRLPKRRSAGEIAFGTRGKEARLLFTFRRLLGKIDEADRRLLLYMAQKMAIR